VSLMQDNMQ